MKPQFLLKKSDFGHLATDLRAGLRRFAEHAEPYRLRWITERIQVEKWPRSAFRLPAWQAHRGHWTSGAPQNTLAALIAARAAGAKMAEIDVRLTKDRVVVLFHDADLADFGQPEVRVKDLNFRELRERVKSRFPLATLREVLTSPDVPDFINIEVKSEEILNDPLERHVAQVVTAAEAQSRVLISSFNPVSIWKMSRLLPAVPRAFLISPDMKERSLREMWYAPFLKIHMVNLDKTMVTESTMRMWRRLGVPVAVWTATDPAEIEHYLALGVSSVITDALPQSKSSPQPESAPESPSRH